MANQTLSPFSPQKTETRKDSSKPLGAMGWLNETLELIANSGGSFVNEGPIKGSNLEDLQKMPELKTGSGFPSSGEITGFQIPSELIRRKKIVAELAAAHSQTISQIPVEDKREKINKLNELQASYTGSVDSEGNVTKYHGANATQKETENLALRLQDERRQKLTTAKGTSSKGFAMGENELGKGEENFGHFTRATG